MWWVQKIGAILRFRIWWLYRLLFKPCNLEIHVSDHCNLNCASCSHYSPLAEPRFCDVGQLQNSLSKLSGVAKAFRTIRLLGGEPLLNPEVTRIIKVVRNYFPDTDIELLTNGILMIPPYVESINETFWETCRENDIIIGVTIYPIGIDYEMIKRVCAEHGVRSYIYGNRTEQSCFDLYYLNPKRSGSKKNYYRCREMDFLQLVGNRLFSCAPCAYVGHLNKAFGYDFEHRKGDYIEIDHMDSIFAVRLFRLRMKPFCKYCVFPHRQINWRKSKCRADEWVQE